MMNKNEIDKNGGYGTKREKEIKSNKKSIFKKE